MTNKLPEALQVAASLAYHTECTLAQVDKAAALLRTQHALLEQARDALETHANQYPHMAKGYTVDALAALNQHLDQP